MAVATRRAGQPLRGVPGIEGPIIGTPHGGTHTLGIWQSDEAVDVGLRVGTPLPSLVTGRVVKTGGQAGTQGRFAGYNVTIEGDGEAFFYAHLSSLSVRAGDRVEAGQIIGRSGAANGEPHLHLGRRGGDPRAFRPSDDGGGGGVPGVTDVAGALGDVGESVLGLGGDAAEATAKAIFNFFADYIGEHAAKALLYVALVGGGATLALVGISRAVGVRAPSREQLVELGTLAATKGKA